MHVLYLVILGGFDVSVGFRLRLQEVIKIVVPSRILNPSRKSKGARKLG
jgi:hypothetical protein